MEVVLEILNTHCLADVSLWERRIVPDESGAFLFASTGLPDNLDGGMAVLNFAGGTLSETVYPTNLPPLGRIQRAGSRVYSMQLCPTLCGGPSGIVGFDFQNGQLITLPGSPYPYGAESDMVIY